MVSLISWGNRSTRRKPPTCHKSLTNFITWYYIECTSPCSNALFQEGPVGSVSYVVRLPNNSYNPITNTAWVSARLCKLQKGCTRLAAASDKNYQLLAHGRWFSPSTPASSTTKTGRHDIAGILLKVTLNTKNQINHWFSCDIRWLHR